MRRSRLVVIGVTVGALTLSACGTRLGNAAFLQAQRGSGTSGSGDLSTGDQGGSGGTNGSAGTAGTQTAAGGANGGSAAGAGGGPGGGGGGGAGAPGNTASDVGVTPNSITIGNITATGGSFGPQAFGVSLNGLKTWVQATNAKGGINGRKINLVTCDDAEDGSQNLACATKLVEQDHVFALIGNNSDASARSASYEYSHSVPDLGFPLNNGYYKYPNMFSYLGGGGYVRNGKQVGNNGQLEQQPWQFRWFNENMHIHKGGFCFYSIAVSQQQGIAEEKGAQSEHIDNTYDCGGSNAGANPAAPTFDTDAVNMKSKGVDGVWDALDTNANAKLCQSFDRNQFHPAAKASTVEIWGQEVGTWSSPCRDSVFVPGTEDSYNDMGNQSVAQFRQDFGAYCKGCPLHEWSLDGYAVGMMFGDALGAMGGSPTRGGFMGWMNGLNNYTAHGLWAPLDYHVYDFSKPHPQCFTVVQWQDPGGWVTKAPLSTCYPDIGWISYPASDDGS
ncbi:MAG TPA: ABC transporter substrate-binding protein [Acidimicrobiales bacterium]|nr:ABC transporter substrate-binding protein [Acidimicrobiales bacterium]